MSHIKKKSVTKPLAKPMLRGHFHQSAFFIALGACAMLLAKTHGVLAFGATVVYSFSLVGLFGISALYHRPHWSPAARTRMRRLDHASIFLLIAGTVTPFCLIGMGGRPGQQLLMLVGIAAGLGILQSLFWVHAPKWLSALLYVAVGWLVIPFIPAAKEALPQGSLALLLAGGALYTVGAVIYALKKPNPWPKVFGYHEIFHILVVIAALLHFLVINQLVS